MSTSEIERLVVTTLHERAETAMSTSDADARLQELVDRADERARWVRRGRAGGVLVAAAALVAAVVWWPGGEDRAVDPAGPEITPAERVATDFLTAAGEYDVDRAMPMLTEDVDVVTTWLGYAGTQALERAIRVDEARASRWDSMACVELTTLAAGGIEVACELAWHDRYTEQLGLGPYAGDLATFIVEDGQIRVFSYSSAAQRNGESEEYGDPFLAWLDETHPEDAALLGALVDPDAGEARFEQALALWQQRLQEYVDTVQAGGR